MTPEQTPVAPQDSTREGQPKALDDPRVGALKELISESFRIRRNHDPVYVDIGGHLNRVRSRQHLIIFGRRGSGKSCLLIHFLNQARATGEIRTIYIQVDEFKRLTYPDVLIRLLIEILEATPVKWRRVKRLFRKPAPSDAFARELRRLLDLADEADVVSRDSHEKTESLGANIAAPTVGKAEAKRGSKRSHDKTLTFRARKLDALERHLKDYKTSLVTHATDGYEYGCVVIDDCLSAARGQPAGRTRLLTQTFARYGALHEDRDRAPSDYAG